MTGYPMRLGILLLFVVAMPAVSQAQGPYEIVRGREVALCKAFVENLNRFSSEPPMTCRRKVHSKSANFSLPQWKPLSKDEAVEVALALMKARAQKGPSDQFAKRFANAKTVVEKSASEARLQVWEAKLDIARNGEPVRVVLVSTGSAARATNSHGTIQFLDRAGPRKRHRGYVVLSPTFTLAQESKIGINEPICQIGHERLRTTKKGDQQ